MAPSIETALVQLPTVEQVAALPVEGLPAFVTQLAAVLAAAGARLSSAAPTPSLAPARLLTVDEAATCVGMSKDWLYRHKTKLPFTRRVGRKVLFDQAGLARWVAARGR
jgi:excisionase family DNA binding protein